MVVSAGELVVVVAVVVLGFGVVVDVLVVALVVVVAGVVLLPAPEPVELGALVLPPAPALPPVVSAALVTLTFFLFLWAPSALAFFCFGLPVGCTVGVADPGDPADWAGSVGTAAATCLAAS